MLKTIIKVILKCVFVFKKCLFCFLARILEQILNKLTFTEVLFVQFWMKLLWAIIALFLRE